MKFPNIASFLKSATTNINIASATAPSNWQVLTATSSTTAAWQTPSAWGWASTQSTFVALDNITAGNILANWLWQYKESNLTSSWTMSFWNSSSSVMWFLQSFTTPNLSNLRILKIKIKLQKTGTLSWNQIFWVQTWAWWTPWWWTIFNWPSNSEISTLMTEYNLVGNMSVSPNSTYSFYGTWLSWDASNYMNILTSGNTYSGWTLYKYSSYSWTSTDQLTDAYFEIVYSYGTNWIYKASAESLDSSNVIWFATNTVSIWWNVIVDTSWVSNTQSGLTTWSYYFLSNTPWGISTTPWTNVVLVWKAVSSTWIQLDIDRVKQLSVITQTVWASPYTYQNTTGRPIILSITGGTVSQVAYSRDNSNYYQTASVTNTVLTLGINDYCKITYTATPTLKAFTL